MLSAPPPGYNPSAINRQSVGMFDTPGLQGKAPIGQYSSSYLPPSSGALPSSLPQGMPVSGAAPGMNMMAAGHPLAGGNIQAVLAALGKGGGFRR